jgi:ABC-2 type transport system permease protein
MRVLWHPAVGTLAVRQITSNRRMLIALLLALAPVLVVVLIKALSAGSTDASERLVDLYPALLVTVIVPLIALIFGSAAFGTEVEDGTVVFLLTKPISRAQIVFSKFVVVATLAVTVSAGSALLTGLAAQGGGLDSAGLITGFTLAAAVGGLLYSTLFMAVGLVTRRGIIIGLLYMVIWEGMLAGWFAGTRLLSIRQYMFAFADWVATVDPELFQAQLDHRVAIQMSFVVVAAAIALAIFKLRNWEVMERG